MNEPLIIKNKMPLWLKYIILLFPFIIACFELRTLDNDFYFLYPTGEYIFNNGFPHTDFLSMHSNMQLVIQQWLSTVIFYLVYSRLGKIGLFALIYLCYAAICVLTYRLNLLICKNEAVAVILASVSNFLIFNQFMVTRPQAFTLLVLLSEIFLLEKYVQSKKYAYLIGLPLLSLLQINLHASMWPMFFVFMLPFIAGAIPVNIKSFKLEANGNIIALLATLAVSAGIGILNPYGTDNMFYLFSSYGNNGLDTTITEMLPVNIGTTNGKTIFAIVLLMVFTVYILKKKPFSVRHVLLLLGTLLLALMHAKGIPYFYIYGIAAFSYIVKDVEIKLPDKITSRINNLYRILIAAILVAIIAFICVRNLTGSISAASARQAHYDNLDEVVKILDRSSEPVVLYANFGDGQYMEYKGYHPYIDGRAELFLQQNNKEFEYYGEYYSLRTGHTYYRDFTDKYMFNYLILNGSSDRYLYETLSHDDEFEIAYEKDGVYLFTRK